MDARGVRKVIFASSLGTVFEWYDFYLYGTLAPFFAPLFFPKANDDRGAARGSFATFAAGFLVRPFGALVFGRIGDLVGRKYTFLVTIMVMGLRPRPSACCPPTRRSASVAGLARAAAPGAGTGARRRVRRRGDLCGGARARREARLHTSWIQTTATLGFFLSLAMIGACRADMDAKRVQRVGLAHPVPALAVPAGDLRLHPAEAERVADLPEMKAEGKTSQGAAQGQLRELAEPRRSCCSRCSAPPPGRASSGTRASSTRCSSCRR